MEQRNFENDRLLVLAKDPHELYVSWSFSSWTIRLAEQWFGAQWEELPKQLRIYDVKWLCFDGERANRHWDVQIENGASQWFVQGVWPDCDFIVDYGVGKAAGGFFTLLRSESVRTPRMSPDKGGETERLYGVLKQEELVTQGLASERLPSQWKHQFDGYSLK